MIANICKDVYGYDFIKIIQFFVNIAFIQFVFVVLTLIFPDFREWILSTARQEDILDISNDKWGGLRSFGLASGYTSSLPMFMGICSLFSFYLFVYFDKLSLKISYFICSFLFIFTVLLNARTGLTPMVLLGFFFPIFFLFNLKKKSKTLIFLIISAFILTSFSHTTLLESDYLERFRMGLEDVNNLTLGKFTGNFEVLSDMWFIPENIYNLIFGSGKDVFGLYSHGSDIGIIRDIYMYGLLNVFVISIVLFYASIPLFKVFSKFFDNLFVIVFVLSFFIFYFKGLILSSNEVMNLLFILIVFCSLFWREIMRNSLDKVK
ncbi:MAG: hypothetical protein L0G48_09865 [Staphylococcus equorum]|uniref:hypothetical protein n=1 Tax=Acinetobacter guillouiae TaxID=106649 RepID=UPI00264FECF9|nr:hypothetical protein [Staphylococcus equorum]